MIKINFIIKIRKKFFRNWSKYAEFCKKYQGINIGENCTISPTTSFGSEPYLIQIGNNVRISTNVEFITHDGGVHVFRTLKKQNIDLFGTIKVGNNVFIGTRVLILPGVNIGDNCVIGAGSIVTKDIPSNTIVAGIPARLICSLEDYYEKNNKRFDYTSDWSPIEKERYLRKKYHVI